MNLAERMTRWEELRSEADRLESEIKDEVLLLGKTQTVGNVTATYSKGRGTYDYASIVQILEPEQEVVEKHTKVTLDWKAIAEESGMTDEIKERFYTPADKATVSLKLK